MSAECVFCRIVRGEIPAARVYEDDDAIAFADRSPQAPVHLLVVPRRHAATVYDVAGVEQLGALLRAAGQAAAAAGVDRSGFRLVLNSGADAGQEVDHLHIHLLGGRSLGWPPG